MGGKSKKQTVGYKYYLGMHMVLCHGPIDKITRIKCDDKVAWSGNNGGGDITIDAPNLFGGEEREGGISGVVNFAFGTPWQDQSDYLVSKLGANIPAFRGVTAAILKQTYIGLSTYLKPWSFQAQRIHVTDGGYTQWNDAKAAIGSDMNPAHIIRECLTSNVWGMGYSDSDIDEASFLAAATTLYNEGMGISLVWDKQISLEDFIGEIIEHINGSLFVDRATGRFTLILVRDDLVYEELPLLDETCIEKIKNFSRPVIGELINSVTVTYCAAGTDKDECVTVQDIALAQAQQSTISVTKKYPGFTSDVIAAKVASRDLFALSIPLITCVIHTDRVAADLNIGEAFRLSWPDFGITDVVMRVTQLAFGNIDSNKIIVSAIQDVFAISDAVIEAPGGTEWEDPVSDPVDCTIRKVFQAPYWDILLRGGQAIADWMGPTNGMFLICGVRPIEDALYANLWTIGASGDYEFRIAMDFCPTATLSANVSLTNTSLAIENGQDLADAEIGTYLQVDEELMRVDSVSDTVIIVGRGVLDTVPAEHSIGTRVYFNGKVSTSDGVTYAINETPGQKLTPVTGRGEYPVASASISNVTISNRAYLPYAPGRFTINGVAFPDQIDETEDVIVAWAHRSRTQQTGESLYDHQAGNIGPEAGTTYTVQLLQTGGTLIKEYTGVTETSQSFAFADFSEHTTIRVTLKSVRDGVDSYQQYDHQFERVEFGGGV